jgi:hypothetical protein
MDWATSSHIPAPRTEPPAPTVLESCWRATSPTGKVLTCAIYRGPVESLVEVRASYPRDEVIRSAVARDMAVARAIADTWLSAAVAKGFTKIPAAG